MIISTLSEFKEDMKLPQENKHKEMDGMQKAIQDMQTEFKEKLIEQITVVLERRSQSQTQVLMVKRWKRSSSSVKLARILVLIFEKKNLSLTLLWRVNIAS